MTDTEKMAEINESLRDLGESEVRWAQLMSRFHSRSPVIAAAERAKHIRRHWNDRATGWKLFEAEGGFKQAI